MPEWRTPELCPVWWAATRPSFSRTATRLPGKRRVNWSAVASPTMPPPTTARSNGAMRSYLRFAPAVPKRARNVNTNQSEQQIRLQERLPQRVHVMPQPVVHLLEPPPRQQPRHPEREDHVVRQVRPVLEPGRQVHADLPVNVPVEQEHLQHVGLVEEQQVGVVDHPQLRRQVHVEPDVEQLQPRVDEVRLPLDLA